MFEHAQQAGSAWEEALDQYHDFYSRQHLAVVFHAPPEVKVLKFQKDGRFIGHFKKEGPPDYVGVSGPWSFCMEAKTSNDGRFPFSMLKVHQAGRMSEWENQDPRHIGLILFWDRKNHSRWAIPWSTIRERYGAWAMAGKAKKGTASLSTDQLQQLAVRFDSPPKGWLFPVREWLERQSPTNHQAATS